MKCSLADCPSNWKNVAGDYRVSTFRFPKDRATLKRWCKSLGIDQDEIVSWKNPRICGWHFEESDLNGNSLDLSLSRTAIPMSIESLNEKYEENTKLNDGNKPSTSMCSSEPSTFELRPDTTLEDDASYMKNDSKQTKQSVPEATADLMTSMADIDFQIAIKEFFRCQYHSAIKHLKMAASLKHPAANFNLAVCYEIGLGVAQNRNMAMHYYRIGSSMGHPKSIYNMAVYRIRGYGGLRKNRELGIKMFRLASKLGVTEAALALNIYDIEKSTIDQT